MTPVTNGKATPFTIRLGNQDLLLERKRVPVDFLKLDPKNQRLSYQLSQLRKEGKKGTDSELHELLWAMDPVKSLYQAIYQNGGLTEDPYVRSDGTVVEGNSRTVALRELHKRYLSDDRFATVNVQFLPDDMTEEQIATLLGQLHIAGKIEWRAYEQAEYVWRMHSQFAKTQDFIANHLRWSKSKVVQKIGAYEETRAYLMETNDPNGLNRFSHFEEFMKKKELRDRRQHDPGFMREFRNWVHDGKFPDAKDVRQLPDVLANQKAFEVLQKQGKTIQAAEAVLNQVDPSRTSDLYYTIDEATRQLRNTPLAEIKALEAHDGSRVEKLRGLYRALKEVSSAAHFDLE